MNTSLKLAAAAIVAFAGFANLPGGAATQAAQAATTLPPLDLSDMRLWNWNGKWHASQWNNAFSTIPWRYDHVVRQANGDAVFVLDNYGAPELQAVNGIPAATRGFWEAEVTLPQLRDGLVVAPLWLYDHGSKDEIDFEFAGRRGLDLTMHTYPGGVHVKDSVRLFSGTDFSGRRMRFGISMDQATRRVDMLVDGKIVKTWYGQTMRSFVSHPMKPCIEMWAAKPTDSGFVSWVGVWTGLPAGGRLQMTVHGYNYTP